MSGFFKINNLILSLVTCSLALLLTVLFFQYVLALTPCKLCIWQRLPHFTVIIMGLLALVNSNFKQIVLNLCAIVMFSSVILASYHVGIEYKFWPGPESCSGVNVSNTLNPELFLEVLLQTPITRCDEITWSFLNVSMAGWNLLISCLLTIFWLIVARLVLRPARP